MYMNRRSVRITEQCGDNEYGRGCGQAIISCTRGFFHLKIICHQQCGGDKVTILYLNAWHCQSFSITPRISLFILFISHYNKIVHN